jgi:hypothetical protein
MKKLLFSLLIALPILANAQTLLTQNFSANDWIGTEANQFVVGVNNTLNGSTPTLGTVTYQDATGIRLFKNGSAANEPASITKKNIAGASGADCLVIKFDAERISTTENINSFSVQIGTNFTATSAAQEARSNSATSNSTTFAELGISLPGATDPKAIAIASFGTQGGVTGPTVTGRQTIYWVVNKSGSTITYTGPDGSAGNTIANNTWDAWIGGVKQFNNNVVMQSAVSAITDVKFALWNGGISELQIDNISITKLSNNGTLPVSFNGLSAQLSGSNVNVNWTTVSETNNDHFEIEASTDGKTFKTVKSVKSKNGNSSTVQEYHETVAITDFAAVLALPLLLGFVGFSSFSRRKKAALFMLGLFAIGSTFVACQKDGGDINSDKAQLSNSIISGQKPVYIRIKQVDNNGEFTYSDVVVAK